MTSFRSFVGKAILFAFAMILSGSADADPIFVTRLSQMLEIEDADVLVLDLDDTVFKQVNGEFYPVDPMMISLIEERERAGALVFAVTARRRPQDDEALRILKELGIRFSPEILDFSAPKELGNPSSFFVRNGVVIAGSGDKGKVLTEVLRRLDIKPKKLVFIDDLNKNVSAVLRSMDEVGVDAVGYNYHAETVPLGRLKARSSCEATFNRAQPRIFDRN